MSDTYQAVFDAMMRQNISHGFEMAGHVFQQAAWEAVERATTPSAIYRPAISIDGNQWCALYGKDLHDGVAGFGDTPELAMADFNKSWREPLLNSPGGLALAK
jgi:hypothetical protein